MSSYGELIQALTVLKNVKEKRHGIKTLASLCANRAFQVRIVQRGGWRSAILPLIISLDEECRKYASLAIANLSTCPAAHQQLLEEEVLRHLVPILQSEEVEAVVVYVLNALGNFGVSKIMWPELQRMNTIENVLATMKNMHRDDIKLNALFCLSNLSLDPVQRAWMMERQTYEYVWQHLQHPDFQIMQYSLAILRGLSVEPLAQDIFPRMGLMPLLLGIYQSQAPFSLKTLTLNILLQFSFLHKNGPALTEGNAMLVIESAAKGDTNIEYLPIGIQIISNLCEIVDLHDKIIESPLFAALTENIQNDNTAIQQHVVRAFMHLSLSPKYHHVLLSTGVCSNTCPIAMGERLSVEMRTNALQMMAAICATHPTTPTDGDIMDLLFLICNSQEQIEVRRAAMLVIANASADSSNEQNLMRKQFIEALIIAMSKATDTILIDYMCLFLHNLTKMDNKAGSMMVQCGYQDHMFTYEKLEALSLTSAIYLCDTCRQLVQDTVVRQTLIQEMLFATLADAWVAYIEDDRLAPHLALMCSAFAYYTDTHQEFVLQGGVRLTIDLYSKTKVEHVRMCCLLTLLYLAETQSSQRSIAQERGIQMLLGACENETHVDLVTNALKALIPFASSDDYRPQLGMDGGIDTFASFFFSDSLEFQQLGAYLLQNLLEFRANRRIFLGIAEEKRCEEDYLEPMVRFLPRYARGNPSKVSRMKKKDDTTKKDDKSLAHKELTPHDPFMVRTCIHSLALLSLEISPVSHERFIELHVPHLLYDLFYSEQIDRSAGEAILLFFANLLHSKIQIQATLMKAIDIIPMLLAAREMDFSSHTNVRCLSAVLAIARGKEFRSKVLAHLDGIMANVNANLSSPERDEDFYSTAAVHCALLCELARSSFDYHEQMAKAGVMEALLVFITLAARGLKDEICVELLMSAVYGISALVASPRSGETCTMNLLNPVTRLQLFMSLLRLSAEDVNNTFYTGTVGIRTLQRTVAPEIRAEDLQVDNIDTESFIDMCAIKPSDFLYRNVIRTLCLLLAKMELRRQVQDATSLQNIVPTCAFSMQSVSDVYLQVFGFILVANFSSEPAAQHSFVNNVPIMNDLLNSCRRYTEPAEQPSKGMQSLSVDSAVSGRSNRSLAGAWSAQSVALNKFLLSMVALTHLAEGAKEVYKTEDEPGSPASPNTSVMSQQNTTSVSEADNFSISQSSLLYLKKQAAICLRDLDSEQLMSERGLNEVEELTANLRVVTVHNALMARIEFEGHEKGGEVKPELVGVVAKAIASQTSSKGLVPVELRSIFKSLRALQAKCHSLLVFVDWCVVHSAYSGLVLAIVECLCAITFLCPLAVLKPIYVYKVLAHCPEWLQPSMTCLFANLLADPGRLEQAPAYPSQDEEDEDLSAQQSDYVFPLIATSTLEIRQRTLGALANAGVQPGLLQFVLGTGIMRVFRPLPSRAYFMEHFGLIIESARFLTNMTCRPETHAHFCNGGVVAFLRDVLSHSLDLLHSGITNPHQDNDVYEYFDAIFDEDDVPPLGMRIRWEMPPQLTEVLPNTPAARFAGALSNGDELIEINGVDVTAMQHTQIAPLFEDRPLKVVFRRKAERTMRPATRPGGTTGSNTAGSGWMNGLELQTVEDVAVYGNRAQYVEIFNLALLSVHNLATDMKNHTVIGAEPKILSLLFQVLPSDVLSPSLRRLLFSTLTCLAQQRDITGHVFEAMSDYLQNFEHPDTSLQKYVLLCANMYYTGMKPEEIKPDRSKLTFVVGQMASLGSEDESKRNLVEIMHGMAQAPVERRASFVCRETLVPVIGFMELYHYWEVQARTFEVVYFLTLAACDPLLWISLDILPRMSKAATRMQQDSLEDPNLSPRADALWEITMRTADICLEYDPLVQEMGRCVDIDRYLMDFLCDGTKKGNLVRVAAHLMVGLLTSANAEVCWLRWKSMGFAERVIQWFGQRRFALVAPNASLKDEHGGVSLGEGVDYMLHMLLSVLENDVSIARALISAEILACIEIRTQCHVEFYRQPRSAQDPQELARVNTAFKGNAQILTACVGEPHGLEAMSKTTLEQPLVSLLELPTEEFTVPSLMVLAALCGHKHSCTVLLNDGNFIKALRNLENQLEQQGNPRLADELEYISCILDKICCHPDLAHTVHGSFFRLLCLLRVKSPTIQAQLLALRALTHCTLVHPEKQHSLAENGVECLFHLMATISCLRTEGDEVESQQSMERRQMAASVAQVAECHPHEARLIVHYTRALLCESVSASHFVCRKMFDELDCFNLLVDFGSNLEVSHKKVDSGEQKFELAAAEFLNCLQTMMHLLLCVVFRQGDQKEAAPPDVVMALVRVLGVVGRLALPDPEEEDPEETTRRALAELVVTDVRSLFYLSALLREVCARPLESEFLNILRSPTFFLALEACIFLATQRLRVEGRESHDLFVNKKTKGPGTKSSPLAGHMEEFRLSLVFEHVLVALRHTLSQAMYVKAGGGSASDPWRWEAQEKSKAHLQVLSWLPQVYGHYNDVPAIRMETVRYLCAVSAFYAAPRAGYQPGGSFDAPPPKKEESDEDEDDVDDDPTSDVYKLTQLFSLLEPSVLQILTTELETSENPCTMVLASLTVANLASYEQWRRERRHQNPVLPVTELERLVAAVLRALLRTAEIPLEIAASNMRHAFRVLNNLSAFNNTFLTCKMHHAGVLKVMQEIFDLFFRDALKLPSTKEYVATIQTMVMLLRSFASAGCLAEADLAEQRKTWDLTVPRKYVEELHCEEILQHSFDVIGLLNMIVRAARGLTDTSREWAKSEEKPQIILTGMFDDVLASLQTLLRRTDLYGNMDWEQLDKVKLEKLLKDMKAHRFEQTGKFEDEGILTVLYLLTKQGFAYGDLAFPEYLMEVAYGPREDHTIMQDVAAVCCAIISTQNALRTGGVSVNVTNVLQDYASFIHSLSKVPDPRLQLWHYRLLTQWSQKPRVLEEISSDEAALRFVVEKLLDPSLGRYSVVIVHNISVLRWQPLLRGRCLLATACEAYRRLAPEPDEQLGTGNEPRERRLLRRLLLASVRNCALAVENLEADLSLDDLTAIVGLVDAVESADCPLFLATLLHVCQRGGATRSAVAVAAQAPLLELLSRFLVQRTRACQHQTSKEEEDVLDPILDIYQILELRDNGQQEEMPDLSRSTAGLTVKDAPASPTIKGLGKKPSLYQRSRWAKAAGNVPSGQTGPQTTKLETAKSDIGDMKRREDEFVYFAVVEILAHVTFHVDRLREIQGAPEEKVEAPEEKGREAEASPDPPAALYQTVEGIRIAFDRHPVLSWMGILHEQVTLHQRRRVVLSDLFVHVSAKFVWHSWSNELLRGHFNTPPILEALAALTPFFLEWPNEEVRHLLSEVTLHAGLHRYQVVREYLADHHEVYPELSCAVLVHALVDQEAPLTIRQATQYIGVFVELLRNRRLSWSGLKRLVVGFELALLSGHPAGFCAHLAQTEHFLLGALLEQMRTYSETGFVKQAMAVALAVTVGQFYKPTPDVDQFVLRVLDLAPPLMETEFVLIFPVFHRLAVVGGKRVQAPMLSRKLHLRCARLLEEATAALEMAIKAGAPLEVQSTGSVAGYLNFRHRIQWILTIFASFASPEDAPVGSAGMRGLESVVQFESFIVVDLMSILIRILRADPDTYEAIISCFLISSVATSPLIPPYMPDMLKVAESAFPELIYPKEEYEALTPTRAGLLKVRSAQQSSAERHLRCPSPNRMYTALRRNFIHILANAGFLPAARPALTSSPGCFNFLLRLLPEQELFQDWIAPFHTKLYCLAQLCTNDEDHRFLLDFGLMDVLNQAVVQVVQTRGGNVCDMRLIWLHCIVSLARFSGKTLLKDAEFRSLIGLSIDFIETMLQEICQPSKDQLSAAHSISLGFECQQAVASAFLNLARRLEFGDLQAKYALYLLCLACSAPLKSLRILACDHLIMLLTEGHRPEVIGALLLQTPCVDSFEQILRGPFDDMALKCARLMVAFTQMAGYRVHVKLLPSLHTITGLLGNPTMSAARIVGLAELFLTLTQEGSLEVLDNLGDLEDITPFLSLARATQSNRRDFVERWLEGYGSSLYEIDEVMEVFRASTLRGLLHVAARCTLEPEKARKLRRLIFAIIEKRCKNWRASAFGLRHFLSEPLISSMLPMCELQPDLTAAVVALFHSFITHGEQELIERLWTGDHLGWICKRMALKSRAQAATAQASSTPLKAAVVKNAWEKHFDLTVSQAMCLRLVWELYDKYQDELCTKAVKLECLVKNWMEYLMYYCHFAWPLREMREVEQATGTSIILAMVIAFRVNLDADAPMHMKLIQQGIIHLSFTILLPNPAEQKAMRAAISMTSEDPAVLSEDLLHMLPEAKILAGGIVARLTHLRESHKLVKDRAFRHTPVAMLAQLYHWRKAVFENQGTLSVVDSVALLERCSTLYMALLSSLPLDWHLEHLGLPVMGALSPFFLELWSNHGNPVVKHHALRLFSCYCQVHRLYVAVLSNGTHAAMLTQAVHRIFGSFDVRELRHVIWLVVASLAHMLSIPTLPEIFSSQIEKELALPESAPFVEIVQQGGVEVANLAAANHLILPSFLKQVITWCEQPGDDYARCWCLWIVTTILMHEGGEEEKGEKAEKSDTIITFPAGANEQHLRRRAKLAQEQQAVAVRGAASDEIKVVKPCCRTNWLHENPRLQSTIAKICGPALASTWKDLTFAGCATAVSSIVHLPQFLQPFVQSLNGKDLASGLRMPDRPLMLATLLLMSVLSSLRLSLKAKNLAEDFLRRFFDLQKHIIEELVRSGDGDYDALMTWLVEPPAGQGNEADFQCLAAFMIGQCVTPPLAAAPGLDVDVAAPMTLEAGSTDTPNLPPPVTQCQTPPAPLLEYIARAVLDEDQRVGQRRSGGKGPLFSTMLCHLMYALATSVPKHPKVAAFSAAVRGAAFSQLMKVQSIVAQSMQPRALFDPADGKLAKPFVYVRAIACIRAALQCILGSWFTADFGARFAVTEEGGRDFIQYCTKHINQVYNNKTALTRVLGTPWERVMLSQGPTNTIAELLLAVCSSDNNLIEVSKLGGEAALHNLSRYGDTQQVRQQATMLLTKLAVMTQH